eukprot:18576_2
MKFLKTTRIGGRKSRRRENTTSRSCLSTRRLTRSWAMQRECVDEAATKTSQARFQISRSSAKSFPDSMLTPCSFDSLV